MPLATRDALLDADDAYRRREDEHHVELMKAGIQAVVRGIAQANLVLLQAAR